MVHFQTLALVAWLASAVTASPLTPRQQDENLLGLKFNSSVAASPALTELKDLLVDAPGYADRQAILLPNPPDASNITFTFINNTVTNGTGGTIALSTLESFPALIGTNVGMAVGFVNPCGLNVPHSHPRANEFLTVIQGELTGALVLESNPGGTGNVVGQPAPVNGPIPQVEVKLTNFTGMLFPKGETHWQFNPTCEPAIFAAAFDNADPGRTQIARNFFSNVPDDVLIAATGGDLETLDPKRIAEFQNNIPTSFAVVIEECAAKCGLTS